MTFDGDAGKDENDKAKLVFDYWNNKRAEYGSKCPACRALSPQRRKAINARLKEVNGVVSYAFDAIDNVLKGKFYNGDNDRGWVASIDTVFEPSKFMKYAEGNIAKGDSEKILRTVVKQGEAVQYMGDHTDEDYKKGLW